MTYSTFIQFYKNTLTFKRSFKSGKNQIVLSLSLVLCILLFNSNLSHAQIYQHNFNNIGYPPTQTQLSSPGTLGSGLTSTWESPSNSFITRVEGGNKALSLKGWATTYDLKLTFASCKKLELTNIEFKALSGTNSTVVVKVNGNNYGTQVPTTSTYSNIAQAATLSNLMSEVIISIIVYNFDFSDSYSSIDDFTVYGTLSDFTTPVTAVSFDPTAQTERCQGYDNRTYTATVDTYYRSLQYSLDAGSLAGGVQIVPSTGNVTFPPTFSGQTTITASVVGCQNESTTKTHQILVKAGGIPSVNSDYQLTFNPGGGTEIGEGCSSAGFIFSIALDNDKINAGLRFQNGVRHFEFSTLPASQGIICYFNLYYTQADFNNYVGGQPLPKNPTDTQGKKNLRLEVFYDGSEITGVPDVLVDPEEGGIEWDTSEKRWKVSFALPYGFSALTKIFLSEVGSSLPVKIETIAAKRSAEGNQIIWKTSEETSFSHFELESSESPRKGFRYLATVSSNGNSIGGVYSYTDLSAAIIKYYRLKMVDTDGSFEYSKVVVVKDATEINDLTVYPNPVQNEVFVESPDVVHRIDLIDSRGGKILDKSFQNSEKTLRISLPKLPLGEYYLKVNADSEKPRSRKIIIK